MFLYLTVKELFTLSDEELIKKIVKTNDSYLFSILYDRYSKTIYNKCLGFCKSKEEAEDLTHDIFLKLFLKLRTFKGRRFSIWMYSFIYIHCVNHVQKRKKNPEVSINESLKKLTSKKLLDEKILSLKAERLEKGLELIDPNNKVILLLKYQDNLSISEIQEVLGISKNAVETKLKIAQQKVLTIYDRLL